MKKLFCSLALFLGLSQASFASDKTDFVTLQGTWFDEDYLFVLHKVWQDVKGSWGNSRYSLAWNPYETELKGRSAGVAQRISIDDHWGEVRGESLCGDHDFTYTKEAPFVVDGLFCHQLITRTFESDEAMKHWIKSELIRDLVVDFPEPTRAGVYEFLYELVGFERI